jgi:hypothetical protein
MSKDPQRVGGRYLCGYWHQEYEVLEMWRVSRTQWYRVRWADGHETQHCTSWDARNDRVVSQPA